MSGKNQVPITFNWQTANPQTNFLPNNIASGSLPSGSPSGAMASTNTIYTNIVEVAKMDNHGIEVAWTGTPVGTLTVLGSVSGANWFSLTFSPVLNQPAGSAGNYGLDLNQYPWKFIMFQYTNTSGTGSITLYNQLKDLN